MDIDKIIEMLSLRPLPFEGGFFRETYRSGASLRLNGEERSLSTAIFYLLREGEVSRIHRIGSDEIWHFYLGDPVEVYVFEGAGRCVLKALGPDIGNGELPQIAVPGKCWQGARLREGGKFALMGTTCSPAFEGADLELGDREELISLYGGFSEIIRSLT